MMQPDSAENSLNRDEDPPSENGYDTASEHFPDNDQVPPALYEGPRQVRGKCSRLWTFISRLWRSIKIIKFLGATNINLVYFIIVLSLGAVLSLSVSMKKPVNINESYIHYFFVIAMGIAVVWMFGACGCRDPPCGCCLARREAATQIPCYMIIGLTVFCLGSCFISAVDFLLFLYTFTCPIAKADSVNSEGIYDLAKVIFLILQLHFFCRFSDVTFYRRCCTSFFIVHIIAVNLSTWFYYIVDESVDHPIHSYPNCSAFNNMEAFVRSADQYLYPFNIEYTVMSSVLLLLMWFELRKRETNRVNQNNQGDQDRQDGQGGMCCSIDCIWLKIKNWLTEMCHCRQPNAVGSERDPKTMLFWKSAITGYTIGVLLLTAYLVLIVLSAIEYTHEKSAKWYYGVRILLFIVMFASSMCGLCYLPKPRSGSHSKLHTRVDSILIMIGVCGCYVITLFEGISAISDQSTLCNSTNATNTTNQIPRFCPFLDIFIADSVVSLFQFSLQAIFVVKALRRGHEEVSLATPVALAIVRNASAILSLGNFGIWVMDTFELKELKDAVQSQIEISAYGGNWKILAHIAYPLCIFFRLHSAFCFFEIVINRFGVAAAQPSLGYYGYRRIHPRQRTGSGSVTY